MKLLDEKGRLFGVINVIDLLVILLAAALVCVGGYVLLHHGDSVDGAAVEKVAVTLTVLSEKSDPAVAKAMQDSCGGTLISEGAFLESATLTSAEITDYCEMVTDEDGNTQYVPDARYCNLRLTVTALLETDELPVYYLGAQAVYIGASVWVKTEFAGVAGTVVEMEVQE